MSTLSFGFPSLSPSTTEEAWFPRLETDELCLVNELEDNIRLEIEKMRNHPYPKYVGATPEEEDDSTMDDDDDQEEKAREVQDVASAGAGATGGDDGVGDHVDIDEEEDEEDEEEEEMSE